MLHSDKHICLLVRAISQEAKNTILNIWIWKKVATLSFHVPDKNCLQCCLTGQHYNCLQPGFRSELGSCVWKKRIMWKNGWEGFSLWIHLWTERVPESVFSKGMILVALLSRNLYGLTTGLSLFCVLAVLDPILGYSVPCLWKFCSFFMNVTLLLLVLNT